MRGAITVTRAPAASDTEAARPRARPGPERGGPDARRDHRDEVAGIERHGSCEAAGHVDVRLVAGRDRPRGAGALADRLASRNVRADAHRTAGALILVRAVRDAADEWTDVA